MFDNVTILVVIANSIWLGVDADMNQEAILFNAHPVIIAGVQVALGNPNPQSDSRLC